MDVLAQNSGIASLVIGACGTAIAVATVAIRLIAFVFKKRKKIIEPIRRLLKHLYETAPRENDEDQEEIQTLEKLQRACDTVDGAHDLDAGVTPLLMLLSPRHACKVLESAHWLVESYHHEFESMREQKQYIGTRASVFAVSDVTESIISVVEFIHRAFEASHDNKTSRTLISSYEVLEKIYAATGDGSLTPASANEVLKQLVFFLGAVIRFDKLISKDKECPERYTLWPNEEEGLDMSLYLVRVRDEIRDVLMQEIRPYRLEGAKTRRAAIINEAESSSEPAQKKRKQMDSSDD